MTFGPFVLDMDAERLTLLVSRADRGVTLDQLMAEVWSGVHVSAHTVTISEIRKALGDCGRWISRRRGRYRLVVPRTSER
jgi:DNA-binding winged helix-turn-helix (wHTH) protein